MKNQGYSGILLRFFRAVLLIDASLTIIVGLISYVLGLRTPEAYGTLLIWTGAGLILIACMIGIGGFTARMEDTTAFSLSGIGDKFELF